MVPPDIWVVGAAATENGTRAAFAGGMASFDDDHWRYRGGIGRADINLSFYGISGTGLGGGVTSLAYSLDGWLSSHQVLRRLGVAARAERGDHHKDLVLRAQRRVVF